MWRIDKLQEARVERRLVALAVAAVRLIAVGVLSAAVPRLPDQPATGGVSVKGQIAISPFLGVPSCPSATLS